MTADAFSGALADRYRIERELGYGGMATVYLADDLKHGRKVAIKVMRPEVAAEIGQDRFLREIEIAARLTHPHVLPLFDSGAIDGRVYYVMPYIAGDSLRARLDREKQLGLDDALRISREVASALGHAHQHGLVHRDIKPENILLADGIALVSDFGIARTLRGGQSPTQADTSPAPQTTVGAVLGTPKYMSPEQATGGEVDARSDIYALACVLYEMLAGVPPFVAPTHEALIWMHVSSEPRKITELRPNVPATVASAITRGMQKVPADRFATMAQFAESLMMTTAATPTPAAAQQTETPNNLPKQRSHFIGREKELAECARILADTRLLTLTGVGGSGKTRLGLRLAESMLDSYPDGVWFVDLAAVEANALVSQDVVSTIHATPAGEESDEEAIIRHLRGKRVLLVLDNTEHLLEPSADLADRLLAELPDLRLIVTSREGLGIEGERLFAVRSLRLPGPDVGNDPEELLRFEAVRLFVSRAEETDAEFSFDAANAGSVVDVCRRLDGIPLALELAAARIRALSVDQISRMLDDRFRLLTGGSRSVLERHRTLRATVQWSYDHLEPAEQELFVTLSVFSGGWTLDAAAHVAEADTFETLDRLTRLIDKSLVVTERRRSGETRYRMLETLRQFGLEVLSTSGRADAARARHLDYYAGWIGGMREELRKQFPLEHLRIVIGEMDNIRAALTWGFQERPEPATQITIMLVALWIFPGYLTEGRRWYQRILDRGDAVEPAERAHVLGRAARIAFIQADHETNVRMQEERARIFEAIGDERRLARALVVRANSLSYMGEHDRALELYEQARPKYEALHDATNIGRLETAIGLNHFLRGDLVEARKRFELTLEQATRDGEADRIQVSHGNLAMLDVMEGNGAEAIRRIRLCMQTNAPVENIYAIAHDLPTLAEATRLEGDAHAAAKWLGACDALLEVGDAKLEKLEQDMYDRATTALRESMGDEAFEAAKADGRKLTWKDVVEQA